MRLGDIVRIWKWKHMSESWQLMVDGGEFFSTLKYGVISYLLLQNTTKKSTYSVCVPVLLREHESGMSPYFLLDIIKLTQFSFIFAETHSRIDVVG